MCAAYFVRLLFNVCLLLAIVLIIFAGLAPWWMHFSLVEEVRGVLFYKDYTAGLTSVFCDHVLPSDKHLLEHCQRGFDKRPPEEKTMLICLAVALYCCVLTYAWSCLVFITCCCDQCLAPPLPIFTGIAAISLSIGVVTYVVVTDENPIRHIPDSWGSLVRKSDFGVSLWLAVSAIGCLLIDVIMGIAMVRMYKFPRI